MSTPTYEVAQREDGSFGLKCSDGRIIGTAKTEAEAQFGVDVATWMEEKLGAPGSAVSADAATTSPSVAGSVAGHAPGPWVVDPANCQDVQTAAGEEICSTFDSSVSGETWIIRGVIPWSDDVAQANARLIAAAPDLLLALRELEQRVTMNGGLGEYVAGPPFALTNARAAIAKATQ